MTPPFPPMIALGLMSGTSLDGIDAALITTDGVAVQAFGASLTAPYDAGFRAGLRACLGEKASPETIAAVEAELTDRHAAVVRQLLERAGIEARDVGVIGFHGHTIAHRPEDRYTRQIGDGDRLAEALGIPVVFDLRSADVAAGGQGAPLASTLHMALAAAVPGPLAVLNIGGVANVTWLSGNDAGPLAFDTGPGNALMDDWMHRHTGQVCDTDGVTAAAGVVDTDILGRLMTHAYFSEQPPKSLDRDDFAARAEAVAGLSLADGAATLTAFTVESVAVASRWFPDPVKRWLVCGGGRHNPTVMQRLQARLGVPVEAVEAVGWDGDALEAQAFAFLAVRSLRGLPVTYPGTTGAPQPLTGGRLARPSATV